MSNPRRPLMYRQFVGGCSNSAVETRSSERTDFLFRHHLELSDVLCLDLSIVTVPNVGIELIDRRSYHLYFNLETFERPPRTAPSLPGTAALI